MGKHAVYQPLGQQRVCKGLRGEFFLSGRQRMENETCDV